jgi:hypothetical protein
MEPARPAVCAAGPAGATRLFLAKMDGCGWFGYQETFSMTVNVIQQRTRVVVEGATR